jgi:hypothetical protein
MNEMKGLDQPNDVEKLHMLRDRRHQTMCWLGKHLVSDVIRVIRQYLGLELLFWKETCVQKHS